MNIKTELPTEPGEYWWRESSNHTKWEVVVVVRVGYRLVGYPSNDDECGSRSCLISEWELAYTVGFWARIPTPDEAANDPVRVAAIKAVKSLRDYSGIEDVSAVMYGLTEVLEATK